MPDVQFDLLFNGAELAEGAEAAEAADAKAWETIADVATDSADKLAMEDGPETADAAGVGAADTGAVTYTVGVTVTVDCGMEVLMSAEMDAVPVTILCGVFADVVPDTKTVVIRVVIGYTVINEFPADVAGGPCTTAVVNAEIVVGDAAAGAVDSVAKPALPITDAEARKLEPASRTDT